MKTKKFVLLLIVVLLSAFIVGGCEKKEDFDVGESWKTFMGGVNWGKSILPGSWYEGSLRGLVNLNQSGENLLVSGNLGFGMNDQEQNWRFDGVMGNYELDAQMVMRNNQHFVKIHSFQNNGRQTSTILETLLKTASRYPHNFIYLRNFNPNPRLSWLVQPHKTLEIIQPFITFPAESCDSKSCPLLIDTDLLGFGTSGNLITNTLKAAKKKDIQFVSKENQINIGSLESSGFTMNGTLTAHEIQLQTQSLGLAKRNMNINYNHENSSTVLELQIEENQIPSQHWKAYYQLESNSGSAIVHQLNSDSGGSVRAERKKKSDYIPVNLGKTIDVYNLLGK